MPIPHKLSVTVHRFLIITDEKLDRFALRTPNCILTQESDWRCTYYGKDFTSNIFIAKKLPYYALVAMSFSKNKSFGEYLSYYRTLFGPATEIRDFTLINWVEKFYTTCKNINLNQLEDVLYDDDGDVFITRVKKKGRKAGKKPDKIKSYDQSGYQSDNSDYSHKERVVIGDDDGTAPKVTMNQQKFSALSLYPYPKESNFVIEIFATGNLNVAGIPNDDYFINRVIPYINDKLVTFLELCSVECEEKEMEDLMDEFIF